MPKQKKFSEFEFEEEREEEDETEEEEQSAEDESEEEESDEESEESEEEEDEDEDEDTSKKNKSLSDDSEVEVEIDGKKEKMTLSELKKGFMRQSDYTRKTQELSKGDQKKVVAKAKEVIDNKDEFPAEDVKTAKYLMKIAKKELGLMTREDYDAEESKKKQVSELDGQFKDLKSEVGKMKGMPDVDEEELLQYMQDKGIHNPKSAYLTMNDAQYRDYIIKQAKGTKSYRSDKGTKKIEPNDKKVDVSTEKGHRSYLSDEIKKMKNN